MASGLQYLMGGQTNPYLLAAVFLLVPDVYYVGNQYVGSYLLNTEEGMILCEERVPEFQVTGYYDYSREFDFGNIRVKPVHTPGHTPGCTSFLIYPDAGEETLCLGMLGEWH